MTSLSVFVDRCKLSAEDLKMLAIQDDLADVVIGEGYAKEILDDDYINHLIRNDKRMLSKLVASNLLPSEVIQKVYSNIDFVNVDMPELNDNVKQALTLISDDQRQRLYPSRFSCHNLTIAHQFLKEKGYPDLIGFDPKADIEFIRNAGHADLFTNFECWEDKDFVELGDELLEKVVTDAFANKNDVVSQQNIIYNLKSVLNVCGPKILGIIVSHVTNDDQYQYIRTAFSVVLMGYKDDFYDHISDFKTLELLVSLGYSSKLSFDSIQSYVHHLVSRQEHDKLTSLYLSMTTKHDQMVRYHYERDGLFALPPVTFKVQNFINRYNNTKVADLRQLSYININNVEEETLLVDFLVENIVHDHLKHFINCNQTSSALSFLFDMKSVDNKVKLVSKFKFLLKYFI